MFSSRVDNLAIILFSSTALGVQRHPQYRAGLLDQFVKTLPTCSGDAAAPAHQDISIEDGTMMAPQSQKMSTVVIPALHSRKTLL